MDNIGKSSTLITNQLHENWNSLLKPVIVEDRKIVHLKASALLIASFIKPLCPRTAIIKRT